MDLLQTIQRNLLRGPFRTAIVDDQRRWRGIEVFLAARHLSRHIAVSSRRPHVGLLLPTSGLTSLAIAAAWHAGRVIVPINYLLRPEERDYVIEDAELDAVITVTPMIERFGELPAHVRQIRLDRISWRGIPPLGPPARRGRDEPAALLYTSGTSGRPKGVLLSGANLASNVEQCIAWAGLSRESVFLGVLPQFHCFGLTVLTLLPLALGAKAVYTARFVPRRILDLLREHRPRVVLAIPSMLKALLAARDATPDHFSSVRFLVSGGEPLPQDVFDGYQERFGVTLNEGYGLTETAPVANWCRPQDHRRGSVGPPLPGIEEKIVAPDGSRADMGADGEIRIKGPNVMLGYFKLAHETAAAFDEEGYFRTGDIGHLDAENRLFITGRMKEMMIIGGENVFPRTIEEALDAHPSVAGSAVVGTRDPVRGEAAVAFVEMEPGAAFDENALRAHCRARLAPYQVPRAIHALAELPRSPTGKILRRELLALAENRTAGAPAGRERPGDAPGQTP
ncbi:MAG: AMP-binding protein [Candidatus Eisenbacteria bacterium]